MLTIEQAGVPLQQGCATTSANGSCSSFFMSLAFTSSCIATLQLLPPLLSFIALSKCALAYLLGMCLSPPGCNKCSQDGLCRLHTAEAEKCPHCLSAWSSKCYCLSQAIVVLQSPLICQRNESNLRRESEEVSIGICFPSGDEL